MTPNPREKRLEKAARKAAADFWDASDKWYRPAFIETVSKLIVHIAERERRKALREVLEICDAAKAFYRLMQAKSGPGENDGLFRTFAVEDIERQILNLSKSPNTRARGRKAS